MRNVQLLAVGLDLRWCGQSGLSYALGRGHSHTYACTQTPPRTHINPRSTSCPKMQSFAPKLLKSSFPSSSFWMYFCTSIFSSSCWDVGGEIWSGDLLHVSLADNQSVNYVGVSGQPYLWEPCQVFRCWSEMCGLNRLLRCKSGRTGHICLDGVCLLLCVCVWAFVLAGRQCEAWLW